MILWDHIAEWQSPSYDPLGPSLTPQWDKDQRRWTHWRQPREDTFVKPEMTCWLEPTEASALIEASLRFARGLPQPDVVVTWHERVAARREIRVAVLVTTMPPLRSNAPTGILAVPYWYQGSVEQGPKFESPAPSVWEILSDD